MQAPIAAPPNYSPAPGQAPGVVSTVFGVPLEPGERVLYFRRVNPLPERIFMFIIWVPMILLLGLGFYILYAAITHRKGSTYAQAITSNRLLSIDGHGNPNFAVRWEEVARLQEVRKGGGLAAFGVLDRAGKKYLFGKDVANLRSFIPHAENPAARAQLPAVSFDSAVS